MFGVDSLVCCPLFIPTVIYWLSPFLIVTSCLVVSF